MSQQSFNTGIPPTSNPYTQPPPGSNQKFNPIPPPNTNPSFKPLNPQFQPQPLQQPQFKPLNAPSFTSPTGLSNTAPKTFQPIQPQPGVAPQQPGAPQQFKPISFTPLATPNQSSGGIAPPTGAPGGPVPGSAGPGPTPGGFAAPSFTAPKFQAAPVAPPGGGTLPPPAHSLQPPSHGQHPLPPPQGAQQHLPPPQSQLTSPQGQQLPPPQGQLPPPQSQFQPPPGQFQPIQPQQHVQPPGGGLHNLPPPQGQHQLPPQHGGQHQLPPPQQSHHQPPPPQGMHGMPPPQGGAQHIPQQSVSPQEAFPAHIQPPHPHYIQSCSSVFPLTSTLYSRAQLPQGVVVRPFALPDEQTGPLPLVDFSDTVVRCMECRAYINAYVQFYNNGTTWICNFCGTQNRTPDFYTSPLDNQGVRLDIMSHPELIHSCYEMIASADYTARTSEGLRLPPVPPTYCFIINVSNAALSTQYLPVVCQTIRESLDAMIQNARDPHNPSSISRCRVIFITYDTHCHFYEFKPAKKLPHMHVIPEFLSDIPTGLHCNLQECRPQIEEFLTLLPTMFQYDPHNDHQMNSCFGTALKAVERFSIETPKTGAHVICFTSQLPTVGAGKLPQRDTVLKAGHKLDVVDSLIVKSGQTAKRDPAKTPGGAAAAANKNDKNAPQASPQQFYDELTFKFTRSNVAVDLFVVTPIPPHAAQAQQGADYVPQPSSLYPGPGVDLAAVIECTHLTGGECFYYPHYHPSSQGAGLATDLRLVLSRPLAWDAVYRLRVSLGAQIDDVYGNFSISGNSLIILPTVTPSKTLTFEIRPSQAPPKLRHVFVQGGLLYTNSVGVRIIRVYTLCLPLTQDPLELYNNTDISVVASVLAKHCVGMAISPGGGIVKARQVMLTRVANILKSFKMVQDRPDFNYNNITALPLLGLGFAKCLAIRDSDVPIDLRVFHLYKMLSIGVQPLESFLRPRLLPLHYLTNTMGPSEADQYGLQQANSVVQITPTGRKHVPITLPQEISLSIHNITPDGLFLIDNGFTIFICIGSEYNPPFFHDLFATSQLGYVSLKPLPGDGAPVSPMLQKIHNIIAFLQHPEYTSSTVQPVYVVRQQSQQLPVEFTAMFIEDISANVMSIHQLSQFIAKN